MFLQFTIILQRIAFLELWSQSYYYTVSDTFLPAYLLLLEISRKV